MNSSTVVKLVDVCISYGSLVNRFEHKGNYIVTSNNMKLVHWPLMDVLLHLVEREGAWAGCGPTQSPPRCTKCNSPSVNGQCTNHCIAVYIVIVRCSAVLMWVNAVASHHRRIMCQYHLVRQSEILVENSGIFCISY